MSLSTDFTAAVVFPILLLAGRDVSSLTLAFPHITRVKLIATSTRTYRAIIHWGGAGELSFSFATHEVSDAVVEKYLCFFLNNSFNELDRQSILDHLGRFVRQTTAASFLITEKGIAISHPNMKDLVFQNTRFVKS